MGFNLVVNGCAADLFVEPNALPGVVRVAQVLAGDIEAVSGIRPRVVRDAEELSDYAVLIGTAGLTKLRGADAVAGKREVFSLAYEHNPMANVKEALVITGSDKRGTIYGMFELSRIIGVSPWIWFADAVPKKRTEIVLGDEVPRVSKEPSVRYRGFFINDEWPSYGTWTNKLFGGFNAKMYEQVFLLLLRMRGNYLWPAMWSAIFPNDGPGIENARLADELGVVMGASHHEPCCRQGEEYKYLRGKDSVYGDAWNFLTNEEGITRFWADGLKRSGRFENIITVGMRGEADSAIMGKEATLADNIDLLRRVLKTQNRLIREYVNPELDKVPRMLALYKEVEPYFYGDRDTPGLMDDPELEGVTLMLCEDNYGNMRTLPTEHMKAHRGGYGMYYHFDYHGGPISYEWVNSTQLSKVWEQMGRAYEAGVRDIWIVNVGDLKPQELPLTYFMDLAYDFEEFGTVPNRTEQYVADFAESTFAGAFEAGDEAEAFRRIADTMLSYSAMNAKKRPETLQPSVYSLTEDCEAANMLRICRTIRANCEWLTGRVKPEGEAVLYELVTYPAVASANLVEMMIDAAANRALLLQKDAKADFYADETEARIREDAELIRKYYEVADGKWDGMMGSKHIGFIRWNEELSAPPAVHKLAEVQSGAYVQEDEGYLPHDFRAEALSDCGDDFGTVRPEWAAGRIFPEKTFLMEDSGVLSVAVSEYAEKTAGEDAEYVILTGYGLCDTAAAVLPPGRYYPVGEGPTITYRIALPEEGEYTVNFRFAPHNPRELGGNIRFAFRIDDGPVQCRTIIPDGFRSGDCFNNMWNMGVLINRRDVRLAVPLGEGLHSITVISVDSEAVLENITVTKEPNAVERSYFGIRTTYIEHE